MILLCALEKSVVISEFVVVVVKSASISPFIRETERERERRISLRKTMQYKEL